MVKQKQLDGCMLHDHLVYFIGSLTDADNWKNAALSAPIISQADNRSIPRKKKKTTVGHLFCSEFNKAKQILNVCCESTPPFRGNTIHLVSDLTDKRVRRNNPRSRF